MNAATGRMLTTIPTPDDPVLAAVYSPMAAATRRMISQSGLVCFPAAGKAAFGRRTASTNAQTSTISAATASAQKNQLSGVNADTIQTYLLCALIDRKLATGDPAHAAGRVGSAGRDQDRSRLRPRLRPPLRPPLLAPGWPSGPVR